MIDAIVAHESGKLEEGARCPGHGAAGQGRPAADGRPALSARAVGRDEAAHRDGHLDRPRPAGHRRRRADQRPRRRRPAPGDADARPAPGRARLGRRPHRPRHGADRPVRGPHRRHVRRAPRGGRPGRRDPVEPAASIHPPAHRQPPQADRQGQADRHPGTAAGAAEPAAGLRLPPALPVRLRSLPRRDPASTSRWRRTAGWPATSIRSTPCCRRSPRRSSWTRTRRWRRARPRWRASSIQGRADAQAALADELARAKAHAAARRDLRRGHRATSPNRISTRCTTEGTTDDGDAAARTAQRHQGLPERHPQDRREHDRSPCATPRSIVPSEFPTSTAVAGESGSGKTTMARLLLGFIKPTSGQIIYQGVDVAKMDRGPGPPVPARGPADLPGPLRGLQPVLQGRPRAVHAAPQLRPRQGREGRPAR